MQCAGEKDSCWDVMGAIFDCLDGAKCPGQTRQTRHWFYSEEMLCYARDRSNRLVEQRSHFIMQGGRGFKTL